MNREPVSALPGTRGPRATSFGIGCFHFGVIFTGPRSLTRTEYLRDLRETLSSINTISDIRISDMDADSDVANHITRAPGTLGDGIYFPPLLDLHYSFSIYIPFRIQAQLLDLKEHLIDTGSESFQIYNRYTFYGPVTFVEPKTAGPDASPSSAVVVVREFIESHLSDRPGKLRFEMIGPSPFHADFYLQETQVGDNKKPFSVAYLHKPGYDAITIQARVGGIFEDFNDVKIAAFGALADELSFFYDLMRDRSSFIDRWSRLQTLVRQSIAPSPTQNRWAAVRSFVSRRAVLRNLIHSLLVFRADSAFFRGSLREQYRTLYESGKYQTFIKRYVDEEIANLYDYALAESLEMVRFEYDRATKAFEWTTIVAAAVAGGVVGSLVTALFGVKS